MYIDELRKCLNEIDFKKLEKIKTVLQRCSKVIIIGNGGSFSTAQHIACDLSKKCGINAISLDNMSVLTAWSNDESYEYCFAEQLKNHLTPERLSYDSSGDWLLCLSASGNSPNIIRAAKLAKLIGFGVIGWTGFDGGELGKIADFHLNVPINKYDVAEDVHLIIGHILTRMLCK